MSTESFTPREPQDDIVILTSLLIAQTGAALQDVRHRPGYDADAMDDAIKRYGDRLKKLRSIREELEDIFAEWHV